MKKFLLICGSVLLLSLSSIAVAGSDSGFYLGGSVGTADHDASFRDGDTDINFDDDDAGYKIFAGYNFGLVPFIDLAVEGSYVDFGEAGSEILGGNANVSVTGWDAFGLAGIKLGTLGLFAKAGAIAWDSETEVLANKLDDSGSDPAYGIGARFQIGSLAVRAEYEVFDVDVADIGYFSVGAAWTF